MLCLKKYLNKKLKIELTETELQSIQTILSKHNLKKSDKRILKQLKNCIEFNLGLDDFVWRMRKILKLGRDSSSLSSLTLRYGEVVGKIKFEEKNEKCKITREYFIEKYGKDGAKNILSGRGQSLSNYIRRNGRTIGLKNWEEYIFNRNNTYQKRKRDGKYVKMHTKEKYMAIYGKDEGERRWKKKYDNVKYKNSLQFFIDTYGEVDGRILCREKKDNTSLKTLIAKHGTEVGTKKYISNSIIHSQANTIKGYQSRHGDEIGIFKYNNWLKNVSNGRRHSSISKIANSLFESLDINLEICYYGQNEKALHVDGHYYRPDFRCNDKIIEFYGDYWHCNPINYDKNYEHTLLNLTAGEVWKKDNKRIKKIIEAGYKILIIWEYDFKYNKEEIINQCNNFLMK